MDNFKIYNSPGKGVFLVDEKMVSWDPAVEVYRWSFPGIEWTI